MELFEQIRRDFAQERLSKRALALMYGVHRRTVREASESAVSAPHRRPEGRPTPAPGAYRELIGEWLMADRNAPWKQRHSAHRV